MIKLKDLLPLIDKEVYTTIIDEKGKGVEKDNPNIQEIEVIGITTPYETVYEIEIQIKKDFHKQEQKGFRNLVETNSNNGRTNRATIRKNRGVKEMTKEQFDKLYVGENLAVHCDTEEKAKELLSLAHSFGYKWVGKGTYQDKTNYEEYVEYTCYCIGVGTFGSSNSYTKSGFTIVKYELKNKTTQNKKRIEKIVFNEDKGRVTLVYKDEQDNYGSVISQTKHGDIYSKPFGILIVLIKFSFGKEEAKRIIDECFEFGDTVNDKMYLLLGVLIANENYNSLMLQDIESHEEKEWVYKDYLKRLRKQKRRKK